MGAGVGPSVALFVSHVDHLCSELPPATFFKLEDAAAGAVFRCCS